MPQQPTLGDWDDVRVLLAIAEAGSLSEAARRLGVSQPTIGRRLKALEQAAGGALFDRLPNHVALTELGRTMLPVAQKMGQAADALERALRAQTPAPTAPVRISATNSVALLLAHRLDALQPGGLRVELVASRDRANLARREADIALRMRRLPDTGDLVGRRVGQMRFGLFASRAYLTHQPYWPEAGFVGHRVIALPETDRSPSQSQWLNQAVKGAEIIARMGDVALRHQAVLAGAGISLLPCWLGAAEARLAPILSPIAPLDEDIYLLIHEDLRATPAIRAVADAVAQMLGEQAD